MAGGGEGEGGPGLSCYHSTDNLGYQLTPNIHIPPPAQIFIISVPQALNLSLLLKAQYYIHLHLVLTLSIPRFMKYLFCVKKSVSDEDNN